MNFGPAKKTSNGMEQSRAIVVAVDLLHAELNDRRPPPSALQASAMETEVCDYSSKDTNMISL